MEKFSDTKSCQRDELVKIIKNRIKAYPEFPKPGINFRDVFPLLHHPSLLPDIIELFYERLIDQYPSQKVDIVVGIDSRGFLFGPELARRLECDFVPARKEGKLPGETIKQCYASEYGNECIEIQKEYVKPGKSAIIVDDLIATGGTMAAVHTLLTSAGVQVLECQCIIELPELRGRESLPKDCPVFCLLCFDGKQ